MSQEAKASAAIIGSLPFFVGTIIAFMNPSYIGLLFTTFPGNVLLVISVIMYSLGIFVMKTMINFKM
jgi:tight adherence protein B